MLNIITPVLNGENFIKRNIDAIAKLKTPHKHIIVDGGSEDKTLDILSTYNHLTLVNQIDKLGMYSAINQGISVIEGDYIAYVNCDDIVIPENFDKMYDTINNTNSDLVYSDGYFVYHETGKIVYFKAANRLFRYFLKRGLMPFNQPCSIFTKKIYDRVDGFNNNFKWCGDLDFFRKIATIRNIKIKYIKIPTVTFTIHQKSLTSLNSDFFNDELQKNNLPTPTLLTRTIYYVSRKLNL